MSSSVASLARGQYAPRKESDLRGPCPVVNVLANHGYIPRDGRNVRASELNAAMNEVGLSWALGAVFARPIFFEHVDSHAKPSQLKRSFLARLLYRIRHPWAILFAKFGMRKSGQVDAKGTPCLNLDQLGLPGVVEHDISLTRNDIGEGDNITPQPNLVQDLLASSSDGRSLTAQDLANLRRRRIEAQRAKGHKTLYGAEQHRIGCAEISLILDAFGDGKKVPCEYVRAIFEDERLPIEEGWSRRTWWRLGLFELGRTAKWVGKLIGMEVK